MTNLEAVKSVLYPYDVDENLIAKTMIDNNLLEDEIYGKEQKFDVAKIAIEILLQLVVLSSESNNGYSLSYSIEGLQQRIVSLAKENNLSDMLQDLSFTSSIRDMTDLW